MTAWQPLDLRQRAAGVRLTPTQRRVLGTLLEHAARAPYLSASELAALAGVSQPSVSRLAVVLGFDGYAALRDALRATTSAPPGERSGADSRRQAVEKESERLLRCAARLPAGSAWEEMGAALVRSEPLVVVGVRASRYLAGYLAYLARKIHPAVVDVDGGPTSTEAVTSARESGATAAVVVAMPRYPQITIDLLRCLGELGYRVLLVSDEVMPPVPGRPAEWHLAVPVGTELTFDSHPAALVVLGLVLEAMCNAAPQAAERRLERLDLVASGAGTYWEA